MKLKRVVMLLVLILVIIGTTSYGTFDPNYYKPSDVQTWKETPAIEIGSKIVGVVMIIGTIVAVATLIVLGIKYMIGSVEEKAEYKKSMIPYLIGAVMVFSISTFLTIIMNMTNNLFTTTP